MVEFETMKSEEVKFGNRNFIEVARKKAITPEGENEFVSLSRGFFTPNGERRFKRSFAIPDDKSIVDFVSENLKKMISAEKKEEKKEEKSEKKEEKAEEKKEEKSEKKEEKAEEKSGKKEEKKPDKKEEKPTETKKKEKKKEKK